jgi:hypothetical protein
MENNKLIAEFMGDSHPLHHSVHKAHHNYDTSWDWLMPVILKCKEEMNYNENNDYHYIEDSLLSYLSIDETYLAVVLFIEKHNKNNNNA